MQSAPAQSAAVLDYAAKPMADKMLRRLRGVVTILFCMVLCGAFGWIVQPASYRAVGLLQVAAPTRVKTLLHDGVIAAPENHGLAVAAAVKSREHLKATSHQLGGIVTPAQLASNLDVRPIPDSLLVAVTFTDADPRVAAAAANAAMTGYAAPGVTVAAPAAVATRPHHEKFAVVGGLAVGLLLGIAIVALRWK